MANDLYLYDEIGYYGVDAQDFVAEIQGIEGDINLHINSPGGSVFDGVAILNALQQHKGRITAYVDGLAASMASVIAVAADETIMRKGAFLMIHDPWTLVVGDASALRKEADLLDKIGGTLADLYAEKTGMTVPEIRELMAAETWMNPTEAVAMKFADSSDQEQEAEHKAFALLAKFARVPQAFQAQEGNPRQIEKALRDAGLSKSAARAVMHGGLNNLPSEGRCDAVSEAGAMPEPGLEILNEMTNQLRTLIK